MNAVYFQTTKDLTDPSPFILKHLKVPKPILADNLFRKKLYETSKKDIPALIDFHYQQCEEPSEFADHVIELLEVALDESKGVKYFKTLSFWGDKEKARMFRRRTKYALEYLRSMNSPEPNDTNLIRLPFDGDKVVLADLFKQLLELKLQDGKKAIPLNAKDMARCMITISEQFKGNKLNTAYDYFRNTKGRNDKRTCPKKYRIKVSLEEL
jgi:hypothetical protein